MRMIIFRGMKWAIPRVVIFELFVVVYFVVVDVCVGGMSRKKQTRRMRRVGPF
jgi:formate hydrogenlyase subunit 4